MVLFRLPCLNLFLILRACWKIVVQGSYTFFGVNPGKRNNKMKPFVMCSGSTSQHILRFPKLSHPRNGRHLGKWPTNWKKWHPKTVNPYISLTGSRTWKIQMQKMSSIYFSTITFLYIFSVNALNSTPSLKNGRWKLFIAYISQTGSRTCKIKTQNYRSYIYLQ